MIHALGERGSLGAPDQNTQNLVLPSIISLPQLVPFPTEASLSLGLSQARATTFTFRNSKDLSDF